MIRVADYIAQCLAEMKFETVFMVTGGGAMHLNDAFGREKRLNVLHCHHEQACAMAADAYFRVKGKPAVVNVTTGPGGINALNGVYGAYTDSVGMIVISGQVKWETLVRGTGLKLRQLGDQEVDIVEMARPITKFSAIVEDAKLIRYQLEKAIYLAQEGRPGPVWLDVPMDIQGSLIDPGKLQGFEPPAKNVSKQTALAAKCQQLVELLKTSQRPVIMAGGGVRISGAHKEFLQLIDRLQIPVTTCWNAHDALWNEHPFYAGRPGTIGDRAGNFAVQNSDLVIVLGSRLNIRQISYNWKSFARAATVVMVDVDELELKKPTLSIGLPILADLKDFFPAMMSHLGGYIPKHQEYVTWCKQRVKKYPTVLPEYWNNKTSVNPYCFSETLTNLLQEDELIVTGDGTACVVTFQAAQLKKGQRLFTNSGSASMGFDLPAAIGAWAAAKPMRIICIAGDGSIMMNLQELQTIAHHKIPAKIFVFNNSGYHSIRQTQKNFFPDNVIGCGTESGLSFPDFEKIASAFGLGFARIENQIDLQAKIKSVLDRKEAMICDVMLDLEQQFSPKLSSRKLPDGKMITSPLEDMAPFLDREEFKSNMIISPEQS